MKLVETILRCTFSRKETAQDIERKHRASEVFWSDITYGSITQKWAAEIECADGFPVFLGLFETKDEAIRARAEAESLISVDLFKHYFN